jgi:hypothetical protein
VGDALRDLAQEWWDGTMARNPTVDSDEILASEGFTGYPVSLVRSAAQLRAPDEASVAHVPLDPEDAAVEVDRSIGMPGQALAHEVGPREVLRLRDDRVERELLATTP